MLLETDEEFESSRLFVDVNIGTSVLNSIMMIMDVDETKKTE